MQAILESLIELARELGREERKLAILGEGNISAKISHSEFVVKASGSSLGTLSRKDLTVCKTESILRLLKTKTLSDAEIENSLLEARLSETARKPSTESVF